VQFAFSAPVYDAAGNWLGVLVMSKNGTRTIARERWLAALAPIGRTGYVVAVATPYQRALEPSQRLIDLLTLYGGLLNLGFLVIAAIAVWTSLRGTSSLDAIDAN
jgi:hypothetical protein